ncbi:hypothetical protein SZN_05382 [Streptomyces zinciresistens K42]|uniref:Carboxypeptidase regulatory-like domain-containing protein n=1 Tax=Streptomyces zinciresistens K42 TaxID=700597 RepID=G2G6G9_9ACTN|nr:hypothetical protein [Streptomyces zinciresistens]EGX60860.1 hypothetical protein SZN_05382 [Streptomyces zinciresistens K42]
MSRSWKTTILAALAVAGATITPAAAYDAGGPRDPAGTGLWAAATVEPGREGIVEVTADAGRTLGAGSTLTLTAPAGARVTGAPAAGSGYRGSVARGGGSAAYTFDGLDGLDGLDGSDVSDGARPAAWSGRTFPFVVSLPPDAEPGTRLPDCTLALRDARGTVRQRGTCAVTVGLPAPVLARPASGVPLAAAPQTSGTAYPGAQVTVRDALEQEVCATTAAPSGTWSCVPSLALPVGAGRLQATATLNGVSAASEQIDITVAARAQ